MAANNESNLMEETYLKEQPYLCKFCHRVFSSKDSLSRHLPIHTGDFKFKCSLCSKGYMRLSKLEIHMKNQHSLKETFKEEKEIEKTEGFKCDICNLLFTSSSAMKGHRRAHPHMQPDRKYRCSQCPYSASNWSVLMMHTRKHSGERPYSCQICGKAFSMEVSLKTHLRIHTGEKPFECAVCGKAFSQWGNLHRHEWTHEGEGPFMCGACGEKFNLLGKLRNHEKTIHREKESADGIQSNDPPAESHHCYLCNKSFSLKGTLHKHIRTVHNGERPFICGTCGKAFGQKSHLQRHEEGHLPVQREIPRPYVCSVCGKAFSRSNHLRKHQASIHAQDLKNDSSLCSDRLLSSAEHNQKPHEAKVVGKGDESVNQVV